MHSLTDRLDKEHALYKQKAEDEQKKLHKFLTDGAEDWDIRNVVHVLSFPLLLTDNVHQRRMMDKVNQMITDSTVPKRVGWER